MFTEEFMLRNLIKKARELRLLQRAFYGQFLRCLATDTQAAEKHFDELLEIFLSEVTMADAAKSIHSEGEVSP